jgi:cephalosporin-C deacetylase
VGDSPEPGDVPEVRRAAPEQAKRLVGLGAAMPCITANPGTGGSYDAMTRVTEEVRAGVGEDAAVWSGKMHHAGHPERVAVPRLTALVEAGADGVVMSLPGTLPGVTRELAAEAVAAVQDAGAVVRGTVGTSQEGAHPHVVPQLALNAEEAGFGARHFGDSYLPGGATRRSCTRTRWRSAGAGTPGTGWRCRAAGRWTALPEERRARTRASTGRERRKAQRRRYDVLTPGRPGPVARRSRADRATASLCNRARPGLGWSPPTRTRATSASWTASVPPSARWARAAPPSAPSLQETTLLFDMPLDQLRDYRPEPEEPVDFDAFWAKTLAEAERHPVDAEFVPYDAGLTTVDVLDVTFRGFGGQPVKAWLILPRGRSGPLPTVVQYIGYNGGRGIPYSWLTWSALGYAHLVMDNRGQGGGGTSTADTPDLAPEGHGSSSPGFLTRGIEDPYRHYYRRLITDAVRAVDAAKAHPDVDPARVVALGGSQGGGLALAVAGLRDDVAAAVADVPFLCHYRRASQITDDGPYAEVARWLSGNRQHVERAMETLSYFDGVNFAARASCPAWFSVALMDRVCPSSTVFAAYHRYAGPAEIEVFPYNGHEGGAEYDLPRKLAALRQVFGA